MIVATKCSFTEECSVYNELLNALRPCDPIYSDGVPCKFSLPIRFGELYELVLQSVFLGAAGRKPTLWRNAEHNESGTAESRSAIDNLYEAFGSQSSLWIWVVVDQLMQFVVVVRRFHIGALRQVSWRVMDACRV
jgi:hypothetical protein